MSIILRVLLVIFSLIFLMYTLHLVAKERLLLKYSLLWIVLAIALLTCALFPGIAFFASDALGLIAPSNLIFLAGLVLLTIIALSLSVIVSKQTLSIKNLTQRIALLEKEIQRRDVSERKHRE